MKTHTNRSTIKKDVELITALNLLSKDQLENELLTQVKEFCNRNSKETIKDFCYMSIKLLELIGDDLDKELTKTLK